ncbi:AtzH-like domain-containing protein [Microlunatus sp. GCM10028923]|uniref:AtzH-like domain-containing protein n=1 Tax=Microlunatus sp. GCM10028923 TaxID=3273400 RepID=UPI00361E1787
MSERPGVPADLLAAFDQYEAALLADDVAALDAAFADDPETLRGDGNGLLVGHPEISAFRGARGGIPPREIVGMETRMLGADTALIVSVSAFRGGGRGLQTQLWQRIGGRWQITAAHVTGRAAALDRSIWRVVGDPLIRGSAEGPLAGLTVAVKDLFSIAGFAVGAGNPTFLAERPAEDVTAPAVADLLRAGVSVAGIARTDEFAYSITGTDAHYGTPPNGALPGGLPGGSSSGPASAVAAGQVDLGLATDTAGSVRVPASYQGLWGLRTTHGLVSREGLLPLAPSFDTVGWLTRDGATLARVTAGMLGTGAHSGSAAPRLLLPTELIDTISPATRAAFEDWIAAVRARGRVAEVVEVRLGDTADWFDTFRVIQGAEAWRTHGAWVEAHPGALGAAVAARFEAASAITPEQEDAARSRLTQLRARIRSCVDDGLLALPTTPGPAPSRAVSGPELDEVRTTTLRLTTVAAIGGLPAVSAPWLLVTTPQGPAPVGVSLIGAPEHDHELVSRALALAAS